jgi:hypothetical protein
MSTANHSKTDGQSERVNQSIEMLSPVLHQFSPASLGEMDFFM